LLMRLEGAAAGQEEGFPVPERTPAVSVGSAIWHDSISTERREKPQERKMQLRQVGTFVAISVLSLSVAEPIKAADSQTEASALKVLDAFLAAFNGRDIRAFEQTLHFPHYRIAGGTVSVTEKAGTRPDFFGRFAAAFPGWDHSEWERRDVIHSGPTKVHIDTRFVRYRADGSVLARFDSLYIVTKQDGRWGIKARSSFAP